MALPRRRPTTRGWAAACAWRNALRSTGRTPAVSTTVPTGSDGPSREPARSTASTLPCASPGLPPACASAAIARESASTQSRVSRPCGGSAARATHCTPPSAGERRSRRFSEASRPRGPYYEESLAIARADADLAQLHLTLVSLGGLVIDPEKDLERCRQMEQEALDITIELGDYGAELGCRQNLACTLRLLGRLDEAESMMRGVASAAPALYQGFEMASIADDYAAILGGLGQDVAAISALGRRAGVLRRRAHDAQSHAVGRDRGRGGVRARTRSGAEVGRGGWGRSSHTARSRAVRRSADFRRRPRSGIGSARLTTEWRTAAPGSIMSG